MYLKPSKANTTHQTNIIDHEEIYGSVIIVPSKFYK